MKVNPMYTTYHSLRHQPRPVINMAPEELAEYKLHEKLLASQDPSHPALESLRARIAAAETWV